MCFFIFHRYIHDNGNVLEPPFILVCLIQERIHKKSLLTVDRKEEVWSNLVILGNILQRCKWMNMESNFETSQELHKRIQYILRLISLYETDRYLWRFDSLHSHSNFQKNRIWTSSNTNVILWPSSTKEYTNSQSHDILFLMDGSFDADNPSMDYRSTW